MDLNNAEVAVTTQHILDGKEYKDYWVQMSDYSDMGEFLCACSDLFPEEEEPCPMRAAVSILSCPILFTTI